VSENPYESPKSKSDIDPPHDWSLGRITMFVFICLLAIPAALSAAFTLCGVSVIIVGSTNIGGYRTLAAVGLTVGTITGISMFVLIVRSAFKQFGPRRSKPSSPGSNETELSVETRAGATQTE
jgi:cytochrome c biogenesis protein CcdA